MGHGETEYTGHALPACLHQRSIENATNELEPAGLRPCHDEDKHVATE